MTEFLAEIKEILGGEYGAFVKSMDEPPHKGLRVNPLKTNAAEIEKLLGYKMERVPWCADGFYCPNGERPSKSAFYKAGLFYIQEPSAMLPVELLNVKRGERVLDICAAPGGKSAQIAGKLRGTGLLVSNDPSASRSRALVRNLELAGVTNAVVLNEEPRRLAERFPCYFDKILADAPCSGEGMFRRDPAAAKGWNANKPEACSRVQREILKHAAAMLRRGGRLVYSTCTFNRHENEEVVSNAEGLRLLETRRIWPHRERGEGHFAALLEAVGGGEAKGYKNESVVCKPFIDFKENYLNGFGFEGCFQTHGDSLFLVPKGTPNLRGLRVAKGGWFLGEARKGRFVPSQAFAMGLKKENVKYTVELNGENAARYLRGESLEREGGGKHWVLICHHGFPLGWARLVDGRLKNHLPSGWVN